MKIVKLYIIKVDNQNLLTSPLLWYEHLYKCVRVKRSECRSLNLLDCYSDICLLHRKKFKSIIFQHQEFVTSIMFWHIEE